MFSRIRMSLADFGFRNVICITAMAATVFLWIFYSFVVTKNDPTHFHVIEHRPSGKLTVKKDPGHYVKWINKPYQWKWSNSMWFSEYLEEGGKKDESIPLRYNDGAEGTISGIMVYLFDEKTPDSLFIGLQNSYRNQENFEDRVIRPMNTDALKLSAALMSSEQSYTTRKQDLGQMALDQLRNGVYLTTVKRDTIMDFTGERVVSDVTHIQTDAVDDKPLRSEEKSLAKLGIDPLVYSLYEPTYSERVNTTIEKKRTSAMERIISLAKTKLESRKGYMAQIQGNVNVLTQKYEQMADNTLRIVQAETHQDTVRVIAETRRDVAKVREAIAGMKKKIGELEGKKEYTIRQLKIAADEQLVPRLETYVSVEKSKANAFRNTPNMMPSVLISGGEAGGSSSTNQAWEMFLLKEGKKLISGE